MFRAKVKFITSLFMLSLVLLTVTQASTRAQETSHTFTETGKTVSGIFLQYWHAHGGLPQQGYPISDEMTLRSTDGKEYKTQFFERAVFEHHPEYAGTENEVLLKLVGQTFHDRHFGNSPPPNQSVNPTNTYTFQETGHAIGGKFRAYWEAHGGLAQQGFPMTDEFTMVSTDGKVYTTQVFQRAVFELHPEYAGTENEVLLRLLGVEELAELDKPELTATPTVQPQPTEAPTATSVASNAQVYLTLPNSHGSVEIFGGESLDFQLANSIIYSQMFEKVYQHLQMQGNNRTKFKFMPNGNDLVNAYFRDGKYNEIDVHSYSIGTGNGSFVVYATVGIPEQQSAGYVIDIQIPITTRGSLGGASNLDLLYRVFNYDSAADHQAYANAQFTVLFLEMYAAGRLNKADIKRAVGPELSKYFTASSTNEEGKYVYNENAPLVALLGK